MKVAQIEDILKEKIGSSKVKTSQEYLLSYSFDATGIKNLPSIVTFPECDSDISDILKTATQYKIPVTPRGGGVGYSGGSVPVEGGIVIVFTKMNRIIEFNKDNLLLVAEPGVLTSEVINKCEENGFFYPPDPASLKNSTIGGNVAENAGGPRCFKYGVTSDYILSLEGFLMNGQKVEFGSHSIKDVSGYDIKKLIAGSEGTLIVLSRITLRMIPAPEKRILVRCAFDSIRTAADFIKKIILLNLSPAVLEFMDKTSVEAVYEYIGAEKSGDVNAIVLLEFDGNTEEVGNKRKRLEEIISDSGISNIRFAENNMETEELWSIRRNLSPAISSIKPKKINEDISVPLGKVADTIEYISSLGDKHDLKIVMFGHLGDGNIHTNIMIDPGDKREVRESEIVLEKIFKYVISINGTLTGEHGIGLAKKNYLNLQYSSEEIELFRKIKEVFDPDNLLNPGKIF
ncbi:MAG: FAD-linked oxidase C-terminal domain-containing protein [Acidobacteriota bacterium]